MVGLERVGGYVEGRNSLGEPLDVDGIIRGINSSVFAPANLVGGRFISNSDHPTYEFVQALPGDHVIQYYLDFLPGRKSEGDTFRLCLNSMETVHSTIDLSDDGICGPWKPVRDIESHGWGSPK